MQSQLGRAPALGSRLHRAGQREGEEQVSRGRCHLCRRPLLLRASAGGGREPWDVARFLRTVTFFNRPPSPGEALRALFTAPLRMMGGAQAAVPADQAVQPIPLPVRVTQAAAVASAGAGRSASGGRDDEGVVLVAGATGGVGRRVVAQLLLAGRRVRALVRDVDKARRLLAHLPAAPGAALDLAPADITQPATLAPGLFAGVRAVVCCTAVTVAPKEGDTPDRQKYRQGIKFYDPEVVGDTPEQVEWRGVAALLAAVRERLPLSAGKAVFDPADADSAARWGALDDVVMGGVSQSRLTIRPGAGEGGGPAAVFEGVVRAENNGGFASVRTTNFEPPLDLAPYAGLQLRVAGDGLRYKCILRTDAGWDSVAWSASFDTEAAGDGAWQSIELPWAAFRPTMRARTLRDGRALDPSQIRAVQLMLSKFEYDGELNPRFRLGPFALPIAAIRALPPRPLAPRFVHVSSAGVTRPNRPGIDVAQEPPAVQLNDQLGGLLTYKLKGEDAVRGSGLPYAVVRPTALTEEPAGAPLELSQGDTVKGKVSREDVAQLCCALLDMPAALDTTFEVKSSLPFSQPWVVDAASPPAPRDWKALVEGAGLQPRVTGRTVGGRYTGRDPDPELAAPAPGATEKEAVGV